MVELSAIWRGGQLHEGVCHEREDTSYLLHKLAPNGRLFNLCHTSYRQFFALAVKGETPASSADSVYILLNVDALPAASANSHDSFFLGSH